MRKVVRSLLFISLVVCFAYGAHTLMNGHWLYAFYCWLGFLTVLLFLWLLRNYEESETYPDEEEQRGLVEQQMLENGFGRTHF